MKGGRFNQVRVRTPEGVVFTFPLAGPFTRTLAWLVDVMAIAAAGTLFGSVARMFSAISIDFARAMTVLGYFVISTGYGMLCEWMWRGQTLGKRVVHLRVIDERGLPLSFSQVVLRNLLRTVDALPLAYLVGGASMLLSSRAQRLGDLAAGTIVVRHRRTVEPDLRQLFAGKHNSLREHASLSAQLRQQLPSELVGALVQAVVRRDEMEADARVAVFGEIARACRQIVPVPDAWIVSMPDEVFVRNIAEIVLTTTDSKPSGAAIDAGSGGFSVRT